MQKLVRALAKGLGLGSESRLRGAYKERSSKAAPDSRAAHYAILLLRVVAVVPRLLVDFE